MLTKEQIANLSIEQQETLATVELRRARHRQALLDEIRGRGKPLRQGWKIAACWLLLFCTIYCGLEAVKHSTMNIVIAINALIAVNFTAMAYTSHISQRLNALVELLEDERVLEAIPKRPLENDCPKS